MNTSLRKLFFVTSFLIFFSTVSLFSKQSPFHIACRKKIVVVEIECRDCGIIVGLRGMPGGTSDGPLTHNHCPYCNSTNLFRYYAEEPKILSENLDRE